MTSSPVILALSSFVGRDTVGLRAIAPALALSGCSCIELPTIVLSNHPGHPHCCGEPVAPAALLAMLDAIDRNGWLANVAAVLTGYLPTPEHVLAAREAVTRVKAQAPGAIFVLDPILGDDPHGLYIGKAAAEAIRDTLVPIADVLTPNRFELSWLTGQQVQTADDAPRAAAHLTKSAAVVATSIPASTADQIATVLINRGACHIRTLPRRTKVAHGTGDLLSGLLAGALVKGTSIEDAFEIAHHVLARVIAASDGGDLLMLSALTEASTVA